MQTAITTNTQPVPPVQSRSHLGISAGDITISVLSLATCVVTAILAQSMPAATHLLSTSAPSQTSTIPCHTIAIYTTILFLHWPGVHGCYCAPPRDNNHRWKAGRMLMICDAATLHGTNSHLRQENISRSTSFSAVQFRSVQLRAFLTSM